MQNKDFDHSVSIERQITAHVRSLILSGRLPPHTRLPSIRSLTTLWGATFFAIQMAFKRLAAEGLLSQSPMRGTYVTPLGRKLRHICLYHHSELGAAGEFYAHLNIAIYRELSKRNISVTSYFDSRPNEMRNVAPPEIENLVQERTVEAVIASSILPENSGWLTRLGVPTASPLWKDLQRDIFIDLDLFIELAVNEVARQKRKRIGLIYPPPINWTDSSSRPRKPRRDYDRFLKTFEAKAKERNIEIVHSTHSHPHIWHWEEYANEQCKQLFAEAKPPDALVVYPDSLTRGVFTFLLAQRIAVPQSVLLISHRNKEISMYAPFPVTWLTVHIEHFAHRLLEDIDQQMQGRRNMLSKVPVTLENA